jgi:hypothetical protein
MAKYTIELTDTEDKAMSYVALSTQDWAENFLKVRSRKAIKEILELNMEHCNANGITIATGEDAQVTQAFELKAVKTAKERNEEAKKDLPIG